MDEVCSPPELPAYLRSVHDLQPVCGVPSDEEVVGIHAVISMASRVVDVPGMGDSRLLAKLSEHLFSVQMIKYRSKYLRDTTTYTPPTLTHVPVQLEPITGAPSEEQIIKVQDAARLYQQFSNAPSIYDPRVNMELSQHLFDIQMANYMQRAKHKASSTDHGTSSTGPTRTVKEMAGRAEVETATNNVGTGANVLEMDQPVHRALETGIHEALERSNRLAEQANQLIERSNQISERANELLESNRRVEQPSLPADRSNELLEQLNLHFKRSNDLHERSNGLAEQSIKPVEKLGDTLKNINRILMRIQHAIIRASSLS